MQLAEMKPTHITQGWSQIATNWCYTT